jgi:hypothetical protein
MTVTQKTYCIGFRLSEVVQDACNKLNRSLSGVLKDSFINKLHERPPFIKLSPALEANHQEFLQIDEMLCNFSSLEKVQKVRISKFYIFDHEKVCLLIKDMERKTESREDVEELTALKINLCASLESIFPDRIPSDKEPVFIPRITLGITNSDGEKKISNIMNYVPNIYAFKCINLDKISLYVKDSPSHEWRSLRRYSLGSKQELVL